MYPGFLFIGDAVRRGNFVEFQTSIQRLVDFTAERPVSWILGSHIEMTNEPGVPYSYGSNNQPMERILQLDRNHLLELNEALLAMDAEPVQEIHDDFIIQPTN